MWINGIGEIMDPAVTQLYKDVIGAKGYDALGLGDYQKALSLGAALDFTNDGVNNCPSRRQRLV